MAMTDIPVTTLFRANASVTGVINGTTLNGTDDWVAFQFFWPGGDLTDCAIICTAVSGSPVGTVQLFNTDPTSATDPVNLASPIGSAVDTGTLVAGQVEFVSGIGQAALAAGIYALRVIFKSGTSFGLAFNHTNACLFTTGQFPVLVTVLNGGAQTKNNTISFTLAVGAGTTWRNLPELIPPCVLINQSFNDTSNPDEYGLWAGNPWPVDVRICGVHIGHALTTRPDVRIAYYTGTLGSPSQDYTVSIDRDLTRTSSAGGTTLMFEEKQVLDSGTSFGIGIRATSGENLSVLIYDYGSGNEQLMDAYCGQGATLFTREGDSGALTQTIFQTPLIQPLIDGIDPGAGGVTVNELLMGASVM